MHFGLGKVHFGHSKVPRRSSLILALVGFARASDQTLRPTL
ncbi:unnamed protein product [Acidithrix sp. C25]|nr:unnamed protein product [Acidithrix sp. C25]